MNITWMKVNIPALMSQFQNWPRVPHSSQVNSLYSKLISIPGEEVNSQDCGEKLSLTLFPLAPIPGRSDRYIDEWWPVTPEWGWPGLIIMQMAASPPGHQWSPANTLAAHLSLAQLLSPHSAFLKYSGILKLSKVNPAIGLMGLINITNL